MNLFDFIKERGISFSIQFGEGKDTSLGSKLWSWWKGDDKEDKKEEK